MRKRQFKKQQKKLQSGQSKGYRLWKNANKSKVNYNKPAVSESFAKAAKEYQKIPEYIRKKGVAYVAEYIEYKKLARKADNRLRAIERYSEQEYYKGIERYAYARAMRDIEIWSGSGKKRFETKPPDTLQGIRAKINDIVNFLESPTSTKKGVTEIYIKRAESINKKFGTNLTWKELADYYTSKAHTKEGSKYGSDTELLVFATEISTVDVDALTEELRDKYANVEYVRKNLKKKGWKVNTR